MSSALSMRALRIQPAALAARHAASTSGTYRLITTTAATCHTTSPSRQRPLSKPHTSRRLASNQAGAAEQKRGPSSAETNIAPAQESTATIPTPESLLNPPATTRPPPLDVPARDPEKSLPGYLFTVGKTYIKFYKSGLRNILTNRKLLAASSAAAPPKLDHGRSGSQALTFPSRADAILRQRTLHDLMRLPVFGLIILVCGEFTPLVVVAFPRLTPYTCRIPKQNERLRTNAEKRRATSFQNLRFAAPARQLAGTAPPPQSAESSSNDNTTSLTKLAPGHIARTLGLTNQLWDRIGMNSPFSAAVARRAISRIVADDRLIRRDGGVTGLIDDEVVLACEARGLNVRGHEARDLRRRLDEWVRTTTRGGGGGGGDDAQQDTERDVAAYEAVSRLLLSEEVVTGGKTNTEAKKGSDK